MFNKIKEYFFKKKWEAFKLFFTNELVSCGARVDDLDFFNVFYYRGKMTFNINKKMMGTFSLPRRFHDNRLFELMQKHMEMIVERNKKNAGTTLTEVLNSGKDKKD